MIWEIIHGCLIAEPESVLWQAYVVGHNVSKCDNRRIGLRSVERGICPFAAVCMVLLSRSRDPFRNFFSGHVRTSLGGHFGTISIFNAGASILGPGGRAISHVF